jgi:probable HAF family extracellular repeat protein
MFSSMKHSTLARHLGIPRSGARSRKDRGRDAARPSAAHHRRLHWERLEDRALLASYSVVDLGTLGSPDTTQIWGFNDSGQIYGSTSTGGGTSFLYSNGSMTNLNLGTFAPAAVNNAAQIAGTKWVDPCCFDIFRYSNGSMTDLGSLGGILSGAEGINNAGQVVGWADASQFQLERHAFLASNGSITDLKTLGGGPTDWSDAHGINDSGQVVGESSLTLGDTAVTHAFLYSNGTMTDLKTLGGQYSSADHINNSGMIIGESQTASGVWDAFVYSGGKMTDLGSLGLGGTTAYGINNSGDIVGESGTAAAPFTTGLHAFLYADGGMRDLNSLIPSESGWALEKAVAINNVGQIVGWGTNSSGQHHAFLLNPGPTPEKVQPDPADPGGLVVTYQVFQPVPAGQKFPIGVYWATGAKPDNALSKNPPYGQAKDVGDALYTEYVDSSVGPGYHRFYVLPDELLTAPPSATYLMVVADPKETFKGHSYPNAILADQAHISDYSRAQVDKLLPGGGQFYAVLNQTMAKFHIFSLEQRAMFMGQIYLESEHLTNWVEGQSKSWCVDNYWTQKFKNTIWAGTGSNASATVNSTGIVFSVPVSGNNPPATKAFNLKWARGSSTAEASSAARAAATTFQTVQFTRVGNDYTYTFTGAVPPDTGRQFPHLLVVDAATHKVVMDLANTLGNWSPDDAYNFRGGGPIQLTGRHNYQLFADYEGAPAANLMDTSGGKTPVQKLGDQKNPKLGFDAAGFYWETLAGNLNTRTNGFAWGPAAPFNFAISKAINGINKKTGKPNALQDRLDNYIRIRLQLLNNDL